MTKAKSNISEVDVMTPQELKSEILNDFKIANESRQASLLGRREVLTGKAKFGIFGDGKEMPQIALAKQFQNGDFRSGYYRDQTWMMAAGTLSLEEFFSQLYANTDPMAEPNSSGRQMNCHFSTHSLDEDGNWRNLMNQKNSSSDISPTAGQMPRLLGLGLASKFYRNNKNLQTTEFEKFSDKGNEIAFGSIGDASTSEGPFWETMNAISVLEVPVVMSVWDDGYGISVEKKYQTTKASISEALKGFQKEPGTNGMEIFRTKGWDYAHLCLTYEKAAETARKNHIPVLVHVEELTQPQGHSTSGSHERYKSADRLQWEKDFDGIVKFKEWILEKEIATTEELEVIEKAAKKAVREAKTAAWSKFFNPIKETKATVLELLRSIASSSHKKVFIEKIITELDNEDEALQREITQAIRRIIRLSVNESSDARTQLLKWYSTNSAKMDKIFHSFTYSESAHSPLNVESTPVTFDADSPLVDGREILRDNFDYIFSHQPETMIFGEDAGKIGGVNQGLEGLQDKFGKLRVADTGIRETTIVGQGIGMAMRGLRPIAEIQYLDYIMYAIQVISDDLATVQYRSGGKQKAPLIIRTRGHRLEGIWHSGSPLGTIVNAVRGVHVCVPRNMTQAAGFYNTLLKGDDPAIVIESLNGYRLKERKPSNIGTFNVPLGQIEVMKTGSDVTVVTYGSMVRMIEESAKQLLELGISIEVIDVQTMLPFDINHDILKSIKKTNRLLVVDEDVPGGGSAYILQQLMETQNAYYHLDSKPHTLAAFEHRPPYGTDGDYFSKPSIEDIVEKVYAIMRESNPEKFPELFI
ncbi:MAG: 2-oxoisovalerate dehydrogenase E1 component [Salibacteraceae bacterium]|jgi:pyruvate/2-oxoglutarate/acetoin dehydrogenase E1 component/TPP-dependent pyruvate/acetoin dehydrogenase alpha subunit